MRLQGVHNECDGASTRKLKEKSKQRARRQKWTRNQHTEKATACEPDSCEPSSSIGCHRMIHCQAKFHRAAHVRMTVGRTWAWPFGAMGLMIHCEVVTPLFLLDRKRVNKSSWGSPHPLAGLHNQMAPQSSLRAGAQCLTVTHWMTIRQCHAPMGRVTRRRVRPDAPGCGVERWAPAQNGRVSKCSGSRTERTNEPNCRATPKSEYSS
jgi:hypothetical protein